ncbi:hypothetical protein DH2020_002554 [Rehmannia glutinosa]|uniref:Uncharacterized protein n=1 Tax=Rehmannia glutinosa TaxID=99300 RepID=A0ABR0XUE6_REHGL
MASLLHFFFMLQFPFIFMCSMALNSNPKATLHCLHGEFLNAGGVEDLSHLQLLSSLIPSEESDRNYLLNSYNHAFKGFSAKLTENEASTLSGHDEVVSVFPDPILKLHTTRSWDFLEAAADSKFRSKYPVVQNSADVIIGIIDTGIWPESPSFNDRHIGNIPSKWKGVCMEGSDFKKTNCNRKLIGGVTVDNASYYGLARGTARGGLPSARIASYKACTEEGCAGSTILKAIDDAIKDGVDIISISIGMSSIFQSDFLSDPIAIGAFHAEQKGVMVVCSAGNDGPEPYTVVNTAPWIFTVAASSIDRDFQSSIVLGNKKSYKGTAINFSPLRPGSLDPKKVAGKIIVCMNDDLSVPRRIKRLVVEDAKGQGVIIINGQGQITPFDSGTYPFAEVGQTIASQILHYINSTKNPTATILRATEIRHLKPAPVVASFSSRGPGGLTENILKPDIMAPGVAISAVVPRIRSDYSAPGNKSSAFALDPNINGLSSCYWRYGIHQISASTLEFLCDQVSIDDNSIHLKQHGESTDKQLVFLRESPQVGVGEISPISALDPGLAFETTINDHLYFLCYNGYNQKAIRSILSQRDGPRKVKRVVTNMGSSPNATYVSSVNAPPGLLVKVVPKWIVFTEGLKTASFKVFFDGKKASKGYNFGDIKWFDGSHIVRVVFAVNVE